MMQSEEFHYLIFLRHVNQRMMQFKMFDLYFYYPFVFFMLQCHLNNKSQGKFFFFKWYYVGSPNYKFLLFTFLFKTFYSAYMLSVHKAGLWLKK